MGLFNGLLSFFSGNNNNCDDDSSHVISAFEFKPKEDKGDLSTWEREAHATIPNIDLKNCTFDEYSTHQSSVRLAKSFTDIESSGDFLAEGKSYREHLEESYTEEVLRKGFFW